MIILVLILCISLFLLFYVPQYFVEGSAEYTVLTSNANKAKEYNRFSNGAIVAEGGPDLKEIVSDPINVAIYKAYELTKVVSDHEYKIVEDTSLEVEGEEVGINVKHLMNELLNDAKYIGRKAKWVVILAVIENGMIRVYTGSIEGKIVASRGSGFGFDPIFQPIGSDLTLAELEERNEKDNFSARKNAVSALLNGDIVKEVAINEIEEWNGQYQ